MFSQVRLSRLLVDGEIHLLPRPLHSYANTTRLAIVIRWFSRWLQYVREHRYSRNKKVDARKPLKSSFSDELLRRGSLGEKIHSFYLLFLLCETISVRKRFRRWKLWNVFPHCMSGKIFSSFFFSVSPFDSLDTFSLRYSVGSRSWRGSPLFSSSISSFTILLALATAFSVCRKDFSI